MREGEGGDASDPDNGNGGGVGLWGVSASARCEPRAADRRTAPADADRQHTTACGAAFLHQLHCAGNGRGAAAAGGRRSLPTSRRELADHPDHAGIAAAGLRGSAAGVFPVPLCVSISRLLPFLGLGRGSLLGLGGRSLVFRPRTVDRRRTALQPFPPWLLSRLWARLRPSWLRSWVCRRPWRRHGRRASLAGSLALIKRQVLPQARWPTKGYRPMCRHRFGAM